jgi:hypothetical protein
LPVHECSYWSIETGDWVVDADGGTVSIIPFDVRLCCGFIRSAPGHRLGLRCRLKRGDEYRTARSCVKFDLGGGVSRCAPGNAIPGLLVREESCAFRVKNSICKVEQSFDRLRLWRAAECCATQIDRGRVTRGTKVKIMHTKSFRNNDAKIAAMQSRCGVYGPCHGRRSQPSEKNLRILNILDALEKSSGNLQVFKRAQGAQ